MEIGLAFDVDFIYHWTYEEGELVRERLILNYTGYFENLTTGDRSTPVRGTGNTVWTSPTARGPSAGPADR